MSDPDGAVPAALTARWVIPMDGPPLRGGTVELTTDGRIAAVHDRADARSGAVDLGDATLLPGFVNCHTHLEFSDFAAPIPADGTFADWIGATVAARRGRPGEVTDRVNRGLAESLAAGVTTVGEIAAAGWAADRLPPPRARPNLVVFGELIEPRDPPAALAAARAFLSATDDPPGLLRGLSPHAPYSVHPAVPALLAAHADTAAAPWAVHLLETAEEVELLARGTGPLSEAMRRLGAARGDFGANRLRADYLEPLAAAARGLIVHGNRLTRADVDWLAAPGRRHLSVILCPRTHAYFRHPPHPWPALREAGVRVALGTDGRGSNPDLSILGELRFLRARFPARSARRPAGDGNRGGRRRPGRGRRAAAGRRARGPVRAGVDERLGRSGGRPAGGRHEGDGRVAPRTPGVLIGSLPDREPLIGSAEPFPQADFAACRSRMIAAARRTNWSSGSGSGGGVRFAAGGGSAAAGAAGGCPITCVGSSSSTTPGAGGGTSQVITSLSLAASGSGRRNWIGPTRSVSPAFRAVGRLIARPLT